MLCALQGVSARKGDPHRYRHSVPHSFSHGEGGHEQPRRMHVVKCHDNRPLNPPSATTILYGLCMFGCAKQSHRTLLMLQML